MKLETLKIPKVLKSAQPTLNDGQKRSKSVGLIAKMPKFGWKCNGRMTTRFHFKKGRTTAQATRGVTAVFGED